MEGGEDWARERAGTESASNMGTEPRRPTAATCRVSLGERKKCSLLLRKPRQPGQAQNATVAM